MIEPVTVDMMLTAVVGGLDRRTGYWRVAFDLVSKRLRDPRLLAIGLACVALFVAAALLPLPSIDQVRAWADSVGPTFPFLFFLAYALITVFPVPRTFFTLSCGVLFGSLTGIVIAISATTVSAVLAFLAVRAIGRDWFARRMTHPAVRSIDARLERRGWLAVGSMRLIAPLPFSVINYCCGISSVRPLPYALATVVGVIPGTVSVVILGDALTGQTNPALLIVSGVGVALGVAGLILDARMPVPSSEIT
jgi:uncharacterized membrane protein YdjX (TVP38/TMEM64 family)